ncbi:MAG: transglutaminase family protein [Planctomycetes bacterium]|nr:transglutaminase family protein [Planctomycetota bacterium]
MRDALHDLETNDGLFAAAISIAMHADPRIDEQAVARRIGELVARIRSRQRSSDSRATVAHAHTVLFDEMGFRGDREHYYDPQNSFVHAVLERRRGLPITLTLVYKLVLEALGPTVKGINAPGHFLARVEGDAGFRPMLVDPFAGGRVLSVPEAVAQIRSVTGDAVPIDRDLLPLATHRDWILRMLRNLIGIHHAREEPLDRAAMEELALLVAAGASHPPG